MYLQLNRFSESTKQTLGIISLIGSSGEAIVIYSSLELPWRGNQPSMSRIPSGRYRLHRRASKKHGQHLVIENVVGRDLILIHSGNFVFETEGCILIGFNFSDMDRDGFLDVSSSRVALSDLLNRLPVTEIEILIKDSF